MSFKYKAYLPTLDMYVDLVELNTEDYIALVKFISNKDESLIASAFEDIIRSQISEDIYNKLTRIDKFFILCTIRSVCVGPMLSLTFEDKDSKKQYTSRVSILSVLQGIDDVTEKYSRKIKVSEGIEVTLSSPRELFTNTEEELLLSCINTITLNKQTHAFTDMTPEQKSTIVDSLPSSILPVISEYINDINRTYGEVVMFKKVNPYTKAESTEEFTVNMFDNSLISFIITCFSENLKNIYEILYILIRRLHFSGEFIYKSSFAEVKMYIDLYETELKEQEKQANEQERKSAGNSAGPIGNPVAPTP